MVNQFLLAGPCVGELYWEVGRFMPFVLYKKRELERKYSNLKLIVYTRPSRYDAYGKNADMFFPLSILNEDKYLQDCFKLQGMNDCVYYDLANSFYLFFAKFGQIIDHIYPNITTKQFCNKNQFFNASFKYNNLFNTRDDNKKVIDKYLDNSKKIVVLAPRYRSKISRNWTYWQELYNMIFESDFDDYEFVIAGKKPDYVKDKYSRFKDLNEIEYDANKCSILGLTIETIKKSVLVVGSQSALPNISLLLRVPVLEWGNQKTLHTITYNPLRTPVEFILDKDYNISPEIVFSKMKELLK